MALEIGTISGVLGIASFGIQIADSVVKLKSFLDAFREAPLDIKDLLDEIERYGGLLSRVCISSSQDEKFNVSSAYVQDCLDRCVREANALQFLASELDAEISKRNTIGAFKYLMRKERIEKMRNRLEGASALFKFAYTIHAEELSEHRHRQLLDLVVSMSMSRSRNITTESSSAEPRDTTRRLNDETGSSCSIQENRNSFIVTDNYTGFRCFSKNKRKILARIQLPDWTLSAKCGFEISNHPKFTLSSISLQIYRIHPYGSPVIGMISRGDVCGIQQLLSERKVTPFDRYFDHRSTLLECAALHRKLDICRLLIAEGATPELIDWGSALSAAARVYILTDRPLEKLPELLQLLAEGADLPDPFADMRNMAPSHAIFKGDAPTFRWLLCFSSSTHKNQSAKSCVQFLLKLCAGSDWYNLPSKIRIILEGRERDEDLNDALRNGADEAGLTLLHHIAWRFALSYAIFPRNYEHRIDKNSNHEPDPSEIGQTQDAQLSEYISLLSELIMADSHLHKITREAGPSHHHTPLLLIISAYFTSFVLRNQCRDSNVKEELTKGSPDEFISTPTVPTPVHVWLDLLASAGIDLAEYGRREKSLHLWSQVHVDPEFSTSLDQRHLWEKRSKDEYYDRGRNYNVYFRLSNFTYGPLPGDWKFYFVQEWYMGSDWLVEFWDMVEHPERAIPGAWND